MCTAKSERPDVPIQPAGQLNRALCDDKLTDPEDSIRWRLEQRRNRLTRELVQVDEALRLLYADPNAEKNFEILRRARP